MKRWTWIYEIFLMAALVLLIRNFEVLELWLKEVFNINKEVVQWVPLHTLVLQYLTLVVFAISISSFLGFGAGVLIHLRKWASLKELAVLIGGLGVTFPSVAVMALLVPTMGYGYEPVVIALVLYGIFPVLTATLDGLQSVDPLIVQAAQAMGMGSMHVFWNIELPMAAQLIYAGLRTTTIVSIAAATIGATVGAGGLGLPIVTGIRSNNPVLILKGALPVMLIAMLADRIFYRMEHQKKWQ